MEGLTPARMDGSRSEPASGPDDGTRALVPALGRGWRGRCPSCGGGPMMGGYLHVRPSCPSCGEELHHHRADDAPAWATIVIVGHLLVPVLLFVESNFAPPLWLHWAVWPAVTLGLTMWLLPRVKGAIVAMQWAWRMHGFDEHAGGVGEGDAGGDAERGG